MKVKIFEVGSTIMSHCVSLYLLRLLASISTEHKVNPAPPWNQPTESEEGISNSCNDALLLHYLIKVGKDSFNDGGVSRRTAIFASSVSSITLCTAL